MAFPRFCAVGVLIAALAACARQGPPAPVVAGETGSPVVPSIESVDSADSTLARSPGSSVVVHHGQTLYAIARGQGVPIRALIDANGLLPPFHLRAGQTLIVPRLHQHIVQPGETLFGVARRYGVEVSTLVQLNHMGPPYRIKTGLPILLPPQVAAETETAGASGIWAPPAAVALAAPVATPEISAQSPAGLAVAPPSPAASRVGAAAASDGGIVTGVPNAGIATDSASPPPVTTDDTVPSGVPAPAAIVSQALAAPVAAPSAAASSFAAAPSTVATLVPPPASSAAAPSATTETAAAPSVAVAKNIASAVANHRAPISPLFDWPVQGQIISLFGPDAGGGSNDGVNIVAPEGTTVTAAENGTVAYAGDQLKGFGNLLLIKHGDGWVSAYAHNEVLLVKKGQRVHRGQPIARVGSTGGVDQPQLHFELRYGTRAIDPLDHLPPLTEGTG
jgi:murein DD-endopeptidase MepM/ murein hydrolase activator NlpD